MKQIHRCSWANTENQLLKDYHDQEWGRPCHDSQKLFELLSLEIMQAGLSWQTILNKRAAFNQAFDHFDYRRVRKLMPKLPELLTNAAIIRNRRKLIATINNAQVISRLADADQTFDNYIWRFVDNVPIRHHYQSHDEIPATTPLAKTISKQMKNDGFSFVGPVVIYSFMQATGIVNDHETNCFLYRQS